MTTNTADPSAVPADDVRIPVPGGGHLWADRSGAGSPVVLLHGAGMDSRLWDPIVPRLAGHHEVIRFDARGLGRSAPPEAPFSDVDDLRTVLDHFGHRRAALVGLSMGGETSLDFALAHPDRVAALALVGASVSGHSWPATPELSAYSAARRERDAARLAELELSIWASLGRTAPGGELIEVMVADNAERRIISELHIAPSAEGDAEPRLGTITAPTLVVHGDHDHPEIGVIAERLAADLPAARAHRVPDADHYLPLRTPDRLAELLLAHLSRS
ncbi:alpha/beta fold hydrolase [Kitasatospora sp. NPDC090091]|uniref:alpha/beta fold hydrolase n=1 Tax=Kitasatospora sp. NPDC090091 TaxID=3364081 RepID=UPI00381378F2